MKQISNTCLCTLFAGIVLAFLFPAHAADNPKDIEVEASKLQRQLKPMYAKKRALQAALERTVDALARRDRDFEQSVREQHLHLFESHVAPAVLRHEDGSVDVTAACNRDPCIPLVESQDFTVPLSKEFPLGGITIHPSADPNDGFTPYVLLFELSRVNQEYFRRQEAAAGADRRDPEVLAYIITSAIMDTVTDGGYYGLQRDIAMDILREDTEVVRPGIVYFFPWPNDALTKLLPSRDGAEASVHTKSRMYDLMVFGVNWAFVQAEMETTQKAAAWLVSELEKGRDDPEVVTLFKTTGK